MSRSLIALFDGPESIAGVTLVVKATLVLIAGAALAAVFRHRSAAARHLVWVLTSSGALAVAIMSPVALKVPVSITGWAQSGVQVTTPAHATAASVLNAAGPVARSKDPVTIRDSGMPTATAGERFSSSVSAIPGTAIVAAIWLAGAAGVLLWILLGHFGLARIARGAIPAEGETWRSLLAEAVRMNGVTRTVRLGLSTDAGGPVTWGWLHPVILFPLDAESWPIEQRRAALMHEIAHVARYDYVTRLVASVACAVYWFHPLVWLASRRLRTESELACDDRVLTGGVASPEYATHLLSVAHGAREIRLGGFVALSMARPSHLEGRLLAVLDATRERSAISLRGRVGATIAFGLMLVPLAGLRPVLRATPTSTEASSVRQFSESPLVTQRPVESELSALPSPQEQTTQLRHSRESGKPEGATSALLSVRALAPRSDRITTQDSSIVAVERAAPGELLFLDLATGGSVEIRAADEANVRVRIRLGGRDWEKTRVAVERMEGGVRVRSVQEDGSRSYSTSHSFVITVPRRFDIRLRSAGGAVTIIGVEGSFRGHTGGGKLLLERLKGRASLSTGGGEISVSDSDLSGSVSTGGGLVRLSRVLGGLRGSSGSGPVIYSEPSGGSVKGRDVDSTRYDLTGVTVDESRVKIEDGRVTKGGVLHIEKAGGAVNLDAAPHGASIRTGGGDIRVGRATGIVDAHTGGGDMEIGPVAGSVSAVTGAGDVRVTLVDASGEEQTVEITSGSGRVVVELPANLDARIDLETAYTRRFGRATRIESAWGLERDETTAWDDSHGTARRYVRASGQIGNGRGSVRIRTVNGDIVLRRGVR